MSRLKFMPFLFSAGTLVPLLVIHAQPLARDQAQVQVLSQAQTQRQPQEENAHTPVYSAFWALKLQTLEGDTVVFKSLRGKYVLLNFWGEWCVTCLEELPFLIKLNEKYGKDRLRIIGLIKSEDLNRAKKIIHKNQVTWPQIPVTADMEKQFAIRKFPTNLLISPDGEIVMNGFSHHFRDFKKRMGDSVTVIGNNEIKAPGKRRP